MIKSQLPKRTNIHISEVFTKHVENICQILCNKSVAVLERIAKFLVNSNSCWSVALKCNLFETRAGVLVILTANILANWRHRLLVQRSPTLLLYFYRAHYKITQLSIPTHAQLQRHRLKFIKNHLKTPTYLGLRPSSGSYNVLAKISIIIDHCWKFLC